MNKLKKLLLLLLIIFVSIYVTYTLYHDKTVSLISLGDAFALGENSYGEISVGYPDFLVEKLKQTKKVKMFTKDFSGRDYYIKDLIEDIEKNKRILLNNRSLSLKNAMREANYITLSIGACDILSQMSFQHIDRLSKSDTEIIEDITNDMNDLLTEMIKYNKNIILVGYHNLYMNTNDSELFKLLNEAYKKLAMKYKITYIDIYDLIDNTYLENPNSLYLNENGYKLIADQIYQKIKKG